MIHSKTHRGKMRKRLYIGSSQIRFLRYSLGLVYLWFGALKLFPGMSPAQQLAMDTVERLSFQLIPGQVGLILLASWEVGLGLGFILGLRHRLLLTLFFIHLAGTFCPLILFTSLSFTSFPFAFTLLGQYIVKNIVFVAAGWMLWDEEREDLAQE